MNFVAFAKHGPIRSFPGGIFKTGQFNYTIIQIKQHSIIQINYINSIIQTKQHSKAKYLRCMLDETMSGETMILL